MRRFLFVLLQAAALFLSSQLVQAGPNAEFVEIAAKDKFERTELQDLGVNIEAVLTDVIYGEATPDAIARVEAAGFKVRERFPLRSSDFPREDLRYHNYARMTEALDRLVQDNPRLLKKSSIGKSLEGRELWLVEVNSSDQTLPLGATSVPVKPGVLFLGNHHAREHVSAELPLMLLEHLVKLYGQDRAVTDLLDRRIVYFIPMVNPDGVEYDIANGKYKMHRKNMRKNGTRNPGVDLNRNYGFRWGNLEESTAPADSSPQGWPRRKGSGSSANPGDDTYRGSAPFSEPETLAVKAFVEARPNIRVLTSFHTYSELILYPWGYTYDGVGNLEDRKTYEAMARTMARWNGYKAKQSSDLYIATGDTTDWAYGALGIFSFTFELSPAGGWGGGGGFYPGASILDKVFNDNLKPALYLIELADDPHRARLAHDDRLDWLQSR